MARARARRAATALPGHLVRETEWAGLRAGDPVDVHDARTRAGSWRFDAFVTNRETDEAWVEVTGGRPGDERRRSFRPEQLYPHRSLRGGAPTGASLRDAPRLPM